MPAVSRLSVCLIWAVLTAGFLRADEPPTPSAADKFFAQPNVRQPRLSPDGSKIAFLFPHEKRMALGIFDRASNQSRMVLRGEDESIYAFFWKGNDRIVFQADVGGNESFFLGATDLSGKKVLRLAESQRIDDSLTGTVAFLVDTLPTDPARIVVSGYFADNV